MKRTKRIFSFIFIMLLSVSLAFGGTDAFLAGAEGETVTGNTAWYDEAAVEQHIKTASDLLGLLSLCTNANDGKKNSKDKTFYLDNDIDLGGMEWTGIVDFYGIFDGQGHQISNFTQDNIATSTGREKNGGFFRNISGGGVKNLRLVQAENQSVALTLNKSTNASVGGLAGNISAGGVMLENVYVKLNVKFSLGEGGKDGNRVGGVVGMCSAGSASAKVTLTNVIFDGTVTVDTADILRIGMIVGGCSNSANKAGGTVCLNNCFNLAEHTDLDGYQDAESGKYFGVYCGVIAGEEQTAGSHFTNCMDGEPAKTALHGFDATVQKSWESFCAMPVFSVPSGNYTDEQQLEIHSSDANAKIYYTLDGSEPTAANGTLYILPISVDEIVTVKAIAVREGSVTSPVATAAYVFALTAKAPVFSVKTGKYSAAQTVALTSETEGAKIYFTTDGTDPTEQSTCYTAPITVSETCTVKAIAIVDGMKVSDIASAVYMIDLSKEDTGDNTTREEPPAAKPGTSAEEADGTTGQTEKPEAGCASSVAFGAASVFAAVLGVGAILMRKKED